ncbi:hypothetical protein SAMN04488542_11592 [Fontibacillus panacisegetis]|uniref:Uncharacterized protein n=1 Tax=Fontibacillus panacisegetis TaxID=670482 RepID=A0A1G7NBD0_9BACL|nr:hypothetical protein SAMN04488542_11592 [Fontibacillus panacisegetis]
MASNFLNKLVGIQPALASCVLTRKVTTCRSDVLCVIQGVSTWEYYVDRDSGIQCTTPTKVKCGC